MRFNKIAILGVGLIGGSIGLAVKKKRLAREIIGVCRHKSSLKRARKIGAIDKGTLNYKEAVNNADLVILAMPVSQIVKAAKLIMPYLKRSCLITDVGSTKTEIVQAIEKASVHGQFNFVGAHPLAGSEKRGASSARADLFEGAICILTRTGKTKPAALRHIAGFWGKLGCRMKVLTPKTHDKIVALSSHLPHLAAVQLVKVACGCLDFAATGFFDTTRIASSDAEIWTDIFISNKRFTIEAINRYINQLKLTRDLIRKEDRRRLFRQFKRAKTLRDALQE